MNFYMSTVLFYTCSSVYELALYYSLAQYLPFLI